MLLVQATTCESLSVSCTLPHQHTQVRAAQERERLSQIAEDHSRKLAEPSEAARLTALFAAGRLDGTHAAQLAALQVNTVACSSNRC